MTTAPSKMLPARTTFKQQVPRRSASIEDMLDEQDHPRSNPPRNPMHILESVDGDDENEDNDPPPPAIDVDDDEDKDKDDGDGVEDDEAELHLFLLLLCENFAKFSIECLSKDWNSPVYVFFRKTPRIEYKENCQCHVFECAAGRCKSHSGRDIR